MFKRAIVVSTGLVFVTCSSYGEQGETPVPSEATPTVSPEPTPPALPSPPEWAPVADAGCTEGRQVAVSYVIDGDTIVLDVLTDEQEQEHVRLIGIDTPETWPDDEVECYGLEASSQTRSLVDGQEVCLTYDPVITEVDNNQDNYGRTLGYVFFGSEFERFLNAELVAGGYARDYPYTEGAVFESYFADLEEYARDLELGLWGACYGS